jgi:hypothetical protein
MPEKIVQSNRIEEDALRLQERALRVHFGKQAHRLGMFC